MFKAFFWVCFLKYIIFRAISCHPVTSMLQLPKSLEIFLVYLVHNPQALRHSHNTKMWWTQWTSSSREGFFFGSCPFQKRLQNLTHRAGSRIGVGHGNNLSCLWEGNWSDGLSQTPACHSLCHEHHWLVGLSSLLPVQLSWLLFTRVCYQVWKEKRFHQKKKSQDQT